MLKYDKQAAQNIELSYNTPDIANQRLRTLQALAINAGERIIDVGCGTGFLARELAMLTGERGYVLGVDKSADMLETGRTRCADLPQLELKVAGADALPVDDNSFDVITITQVLLYVPDLQAVLSELYRVLKPGGRIAIVETDWRGVVLNSADDALSRKVFDAWQAAVPNPNLPPRLPALLRSYGFGAIRCEAIPIINLNNTPANFSATMFQWMGEQALKLGKVTEDEFRAWQNDLATKADAGEYFFCVNRFLLTAVK